MTDQGKFRLLTRSDFDGLICAALFKEIDMIDEIKFVHPKDMQDGSIEISDRDISANLPFAEGVHLAFDHHRSETHRVGEPSNFINDVDAPSAARVVYDHFGGKTRFPRISEAMMEAVDKSDSASFTTDEILSPKDWILLGFLTDSRTGLGRFRSFRISNYNLMMELINHFRTLDIAEIMKLPDVVERYELFFEHEEKFKDQIRRCSTVHGNLVVLDLRDEDPIWAGNRFMIYALHPQCNISIHIIWGREKQNVVFATGRSILDRSSKTDVGKLMLKHGGGGHEVAGTCQIATEEAEGALQKIIEAITADG